MEDEYRATLKKKIQILFQLGKWLDVVKLCESYSGKYGKDMEIDMIRFKSERHLGISAPAQSDQAHESEKAAAAENRRPQEPAAPETLDDDAFMLGDSPLEAAQEPESLEIAGTAADEMPLVREDKVAYDPAEEDNDLVITDPFAEDEPGFSLAPDQPPVIMSDSPAAVDLEQPALEMESREEHASDPAAEQEAELDFKSLGAMTIDADPQLTPEAPSSSGFWEGRAAVRDAVIGEEPAHPFLGGGDAFTPPVEEAEPPAPRPMVVEKPQPARGASPDFMEEKTATRKKVFSVKLALLVVLPLAAAAVLWLVLSGKLNFSGADAPAADPLPVVKPASAERPARVKKLPPPAAVSPTGQADKDFDEKFLQAGEFLKKGDTLKAWAMLLEAKKIKMTEPLRLLEAQLAAKMQAAEDQAKQESRDVQNQWQQESQAYARAEAESTLAGWQNFLTAYPQGEFAFKAGKKIAALQKKAQEILDQQLLMRIQQAQKIRLRSAYLSMGQADIAAMLRQVSKPQSLFEAHGHGGASVLLDYTSGLMWTLWNKPMAYDKAKWWANRVTAGYGGWRLPTVEEALTLLQMDRSHYAGLAGFGLWTGDTVSDQPRTVWVLKLPEGQFIPAGYEQSLYVWSVRKAGK